MEKEADLPQFPPSLQNLLPGWQVHGTYGDRASPSLEQSPRKASSDKAQGAAFQHEALIRAPEAKAPSCARASHRARVLTACAPACPGKPHTFLSELLDCLFLGGRICAKCHRRAKSNRLWVLIKILVP